MPPLIARHHGHGLGCRFARDPRDYPMRRLLRQLRTLEKPERARPWKHGPILDQGQTSMCTRYSLAARRGAAPIFTKDPLAEVPEEFYRWALANDEFPGEDMDGGTTVRAMCQAGRYFGMLSEFFVTASMADARGVLPRIGPLQFGTEWTEPMFTPDSAGFVKPNGAVAGGHAYTLLWIKRMIPGLDSPDDTAVFQNSWSADWGKRGLFYMRMGDARELLEDRGGESYAVVETKHARRKAA